MRFIFTIVLVFSASANALVFAQGSLEPPAAPGPTMKTLDQVEPRKPLSAGGSISEPGSYYLTNDIGEGITIDSDDVSLDLNGFTVRSNSGYPILIAQQSRVRIFNGAIADSLTDGIRATGSGALHLYDLQIVNSGANCIRIYRSSSGPVLLERVMCDGAGDHGIQYSNFIVNEDDPGADLVIRDNVISRTALSGQVRVGILIDNHIDGAHINIDISGNTLFGGSRGIQVFSTGTGTFAGRVMDNVVTKHALGFFVNTSVLVARNMAHDNSNNYSLNGAIAAPVTGLGSTPGPWDNISD